MRLGGFEELIDSPRLGEERRKCDTESAKAQPWNAHADTDRPSFRNGHAIVIKRQGNHGGRHDQDAHGRHGQKEGLRGLDHDLFSIPGRPEDASHHASRHNTKAHETRKLQISQQGLIHKVVRQIVRHEIVMNEFGTKLVGDGIDTLGHDPIQGLSRQEADFVSLLSNDSIHIVAR